MPPVAAVIAAELAALTWTAIAVSVIKALALTVVMGALSRALTKTPKPKTGGAGISQDRTVTVRQPITAHQFIVGRAKVGGAYTFMRSFENNQRLEMVITFAGHACSSMDEVYFDDNLMTLDGSGNVLSATAPDGTINTKWNGKARIVEGLGAAVDTAFMEYGKTQAPGIWTDNHRQAFRTKVWVTLNYSSDLFAGALPNISIVFSGLMPYDPRTELMGWTTNPVLIMRFYLIAMGIVDADGSNWDDTLAIAEANVCEEAVSILAGGTEERFTCNGLIDTSQAPKTVIPELLTSCLGRLTYVGGKWRMYTAHYRTPTIGFDIDDLDGRIKTLPLISMRENFNAVKGTYYSPDAAWQPTDFTPVKSVTYLNEDNADDYTYADVSFPYTHTDSGCQRLAKIHLSRVRRKVTTFWPLNLAGLLVQPCDSVYLTRTRYGWDEKVFEVTDFQLAIREDGDNTRLGCDLSFRETDANVYEWDVDEEEPPAAAPVTTLPNAATCEPPGAPVITEANVITRSGSRAKTDLTVTYTASADGFATDYEIAYKLHDDPESAYQALPTVKILTQLIYDVSPGYYDFRSRAYNFLGIGSEYAYTLNKEIRGLGDRPADLTGVTLQAVSSIGILRWIQSVDNDVQHGGFIEVRHSEAVDGAATLENSVTIIPLVPGIQDTAIVPLKAGTYLLRAFDVLGLSSANAAVVETKDATVLAFSPLDSVTEEPTFSGTHSNTTSIDGYIKLLSAGMFDDIPVFDELVSLDSYGGVLSEGVYQFAAGIDLTTVQSCRLYTSLDVLAVNVLDNFDRRSGNVDDWADFDGVAGGEADAWIEVRYTDDDPAGTPTWSTWRRLDNNADYNARAFQFRVQLRSYDPTINIHVNNLGVAIKNV
jgi:hypothetical protein